LFVCLFCFNWHLVMRFRNTVYVHSAYRFDSDDSCLKFPCFWCKFNDKQKICKQQSHTIFCEIWLSPKINLLTKPIFLMCVPRNCENLKRKANIRYRILEYFLFRYSAARPFDVTGGAITRFSSWDIMRQTTIRRKPSFFDVYTQKTNPLLQTMYWQRNNLLLQMIFSICCNRFFFSMRWISFFEHDVLLRCMIFFSNMWKYKKKIKISWQRNALQPTNLFSYCSGFVLYARWISSAVDEIPRWRVDFHHAKKI
jgi:hypothetical protein